ncbi:MAG: cupredoxin domain-containing protein [Opitutaceae bacterium]|nr:cupredoxin domain-containing protein [Opitutaceae bacterium]MBP9912321.1 cupredoxin domain-containing protein [Opitutaceae bacterium]
MKTRLLIASALVAFAVAGCSQKEETVAPAVTAATSGPRTIEITASDAMKFNLNAIQLAVGEEVKIVLVNAGTMPKQAMGHNLCVLKAGSDVAAFATAAAVSATTEYIPAALQSEIVAHTKLLGPKESDSIVLKFDAAGDYPFLCTFPAHFQVGMKGLITVK